MAMTKKRRFQFHRCFQNLGYLHSMKTILNGIIMGPYATGKEKRRMQSMLDDIEFLLESYDDNTNTLKEQHEKN